MATSARITEIPAHLHADAFGKGGLREQWYTKLTSNARADRAQVEAVFTMAYTELFELPAPQFAWLESPGDDAVDPADHGGLVDMAKLMEGIQEVCTKPFHPVLAKYFLEIASKDARDKPPVSMDAVGEVFDRVFTGNDSGNKPPQSALKNHSFIVVRLLLMTFIKEDASRFPDLKMTAERQAQILALTDAVAELYGFVTTKTQVICYERPSKIHREDSARGLQIHCETGPAIEFADGKGRYLLDGIVVPEHVVMRPETITIEEIEKNDNIEVRRLMIGQRGIGWYLTGTKAEVIHQDEVKVFAQTATIDPDDRALSMPRALLRDKSKRIYLCGTDGSTDRVYYMMCPGNVRTCAEAHEQLSGGLDESKCVAQS